MRKPLLLALLFTLAACGPGAAAPTSTPAAPTTAPATLPPATATHPPATATDVPPTVEPSATTKPPTATAAPDFFEQQGMIVEHGPTGDWDGRYTDPGAVVYADGQFHLFRNGFQDWPAVVNIGYVTSPDGVTWTEQSEDPILGTADVPYAGLAALASSVLVEPDGTWVLYFYTWESVTFPTHGSIGRATAPAPTGPWTVDPEPVLTAGPVGAWDGQQVLAPDVVRDGDGYVMYYAGQSSTNAVQSIGRATSPDGITWTKYDDPATTSLALAASDPVLTGDPAGTWDKSWVHQPRVIANPDGGWVMFYRGVADKNGQHMALGYATSADGVQWERAAANPILKPQAISGAQNFWFTNVLEHDGTIYLFWEVDTPQTTTSIFLATHTGPLP